MKNSMGLIILLSLAVVAGSYPIYKTFFDKPSTPDKSKPVITVYKSETCGCCKDWVSYLEDEGFAVNAINHDNVDLIKTENGLTDSSLKSCHTAFVDGYVIEGHVPVGDIERLLAEKPIAVGLTAPGMPMMSPGMASLEPKDYDVLLFQKDGKSTVYSSY